MIDPVLVPAKLTARQQQILQLIQSTIQQTGAPPTRAEIAQQLGFKSANAAEEHLQALARKGAIELVSGTSRGIRLKQLPSASAGAGANGSLQILQQWQAQSGLALPLVGRVAAGAPILAQENIEQTFQIEPHLFQQTPDYLLQVRGMSMRDIGIFDGDLLAVRASKEARNGQIVVARIDEEVTVKRFQRETDRIVLLAENVDFSPIYVYPDQAFAIEGLAVGLIRQTFFP